MVGFILFCRFDGIALVWYIWLLTFEIFCLVEKQHKIAQDRTKPGPSTTTTIGTGQNMKQQGQVEPKVQKKRQKKQWLQQLQRNI